MSTPQLYGLIGGLLILAGLVAALLWRGVLAISASLSVKIVPRWQRDTPPPSKQKGAARQAQANGGQGRGPNGQFLPKVVADGRKAS